MECNSSMGLEPDFWLTAGDEGAVGVAGTISTCSGLSTSAAATAAAAEEVGASTAGVKVPLPFSAAP